MLWKVLVGLVALAFLVVLGTWFYFNQVANPRVVAELRSDPKGERAQKVMLVTLPSGRELPMNYWHEGDLVFAGADGRWWRELDGEGAPVTVWLRGDLRRGTARAIRDDPAYKARVFKELRPTALPGVGTLVEIRLAPAESPAPN